MGIKFFALVLWLIVIRQPEFNIIAFVLSLVAFGVTYYFWSIYMSAIASVLIFAYYATLPTLSYNAYTVIVLGIYFVYYLWVMGLLKGGGGSDDGFSAYDCSDGFDGSDE